MDMSLLKRAMEASKPKEEERRFYFSGDLMRDHRVEFILKWSKLEGWHVIHNKQVYQFCPPRMLSDVLHRYHRQYPRIRKFRVQCERRTDRLPFTEYRVERADPPCRKR